MWSTQKPPYRRGTYIDNKPSSRSSQACLGKPVTVRCHQRGVANRSVSTSAAVDSRPAGLLLEADGAVMDVHLDGHRVAFNNAFQSIGMDCVQWTPVVYNDLLGISDGTGEGLVRAYYTTVGWPLMVASSERDAFVRKIHQLKDRELGKLLQRDGLPLRPDVKQVISDAVSSGAAVSLLCGTQCTRPEDTAASCVRLLGPQLARAVRVFTFALAPPALGEEGADAPTPMLSQMLSAAAGDLKQRAAMQLICRMKESVEASAAEGASGPMPVGLGVAPALMAAGGAQQRITPEFLGALIATTGVPRGTTVAVAASNATLQAAASAGLVPVAVPRKFASQGSFPAARAKFDGFGPGLATWPRLKALLGNGYGSGGGSGK